MNIKVRRARGSGNDVKENCCLTLPSKPSLLLYDECLCVGYYHK